ncbi:Peroxin/Dysferlin domain-containing protein [Triangularia verruculosa]|uniref:Peroxin/Dysferlin domain-containing protein n=1 Tax=Triangularia verruculosa TaxID=2587418 RepID=A0AAN6XJA1_9PEZI|nr:Peroxin/Dysferlin domain-containing protein [Triangularia verruculosa]
MVDELEAQFLSAADESVLPEEDEGQSPQPRDQQSHSARKVRSLKNGIFRAASIQDKLLEKLLSQVIPSEDGQPQTPSIMGGDDPPTFAERPGFSIPLMSNNFRRFNARIGVVFKFQSRALKVLSWRKPTHTLSLLAVYTFVCLDPYLLFALPLAIAVFFIFVPSFIARHPAPSTSSDPDHQVRNLGYSPRGPPLAPARNFQPTKELSKDFFRNMGDLQNVMEDFSVVHDKVVTLIVPVTNFSDEALSSAIFVILFAALVVMLISAHLIPWRYLMLVGGWGAILSAHPAINRLVAQATEQYLSHPSVIGPGDPNPVKLPTLDVPALLSKEIILDSAPETREVEIFELQRLSHYPGGEWEPWVFSPSPYDPLSAQRISGQRPQGTRFFEDVQPPEGWEWSEKKWGLDLWSREWVEERIITGVEVETEGERWVYDIASASESKTSGSGAGGMGTIGEETEGEQEPVRSNQPTPVKQYGGLSWEEGEEGMGRRGEWRRRRWVRLVKRKNVTG